MGITEELRWTAAKLINVGKFAVDFSVNESLLRGGMQVYAVVKGKLKGGPPPPEPLSNSYRKQNSVVVEEMQAKLEKIQQEQSNMQIRTEEQLEHLKHFSEDPLKSSTTESTRRPKIFIRSRL
ncbi:hypothetical protein ACP275_13G087700 [Erythranthe tilingii]